MRIPALRAAALVCATVIFSAPDAPAQPHTGGVLMGGGFPSNSTSYLNGVFRAMPNGQLTTLVDTFVFPTRPYYMDFVTMDNDNRSVVFACRASGSSVYSHTYGIYRYDPNVNQFTTVSYSTVAFRPAYGLTPDGNGGWYASALSRPNATNMYLVYNIDQNGALTTVLSTMAIGHPQTFNRPVGRDIDTGSLLVPSSQSVGFFSRPVYQVAPDGAITTWNTSSNGPAPNYGWTQEISSGDMVYVEGRRIYRCSQGRTATSNTVIAGTTEQVYGTIFDNQSSASPLLLTYGYTQGNTLTVCNLHWVDPKLSTIVNTQQFIQSNSRALIPYPLASLANDRARHIAAVQTAPGKWTVNLSAPAFPNKQYLFVGSLSGVRPGFSLPNGLRAWLNPDQLFGITAQNLIPAVWNPGPLILDANGEAKAQINLSFLNLPLNVPVHMLMAVVDPAAPGAIGLITEPEVLNP